MDYVYTVDEIKDKLTPIFEVEPIYRAVLFGSYATGEATEKSDIDIVIDSHGALVNWDFYGVLHDITQAIDKEIDLFEITEIHHSSSLMDEIYSKGVVLYEK